MEATLEVGEGPAHEMRPICQSCKKPVPVQDRLGHLLRHLAKNEKIYRFQCTKCKYGSYSMWNVKQHGTFRHKDKDGFIDRIAELSDEVKRMSLICYNHPVVFEPRIGGRQVSRLRASWPVKKPESYWFETAGSSSNDMPSYEDSNGSPDEYISSLMDSVRQPGNKQMFFQRDALDDEINSATAEDRTFDSSPDNGLYWSHHQNASFDVPDTTASSSTPSSDNGRVELLDGPTAENVNNGTWRAINDVKQEVGSRPQVQSRPSVLEHSAPKSDEMVRKNHDMKGLGSIESPEDLEFYEEHRLKMDWDTDELVKNVRVVAERMRFPKKKIDLVVEILEKNDIDSSALSYEDENLTEFFKQANVTYGAKVAIIQILKKMKFQDTCV